ncbi:hypothetical protein VIGAN_04099200 [Vigna angularis var. angularis]|uniref:Uncharacterized protein n=1 Tax=Vigna angularis var. angularis TaxID=157739 RepID=A0A0S3RT75_PHAAN|nr:hypothetical protein VIGAN_04099200 [Vigna angularis var. angularis]
MFTFSRIEFEPQNKFKMCFVAVTGKLWPKLYEIKVSPITTPIDKGTIEELCLPDIHHKELKLNRQYLLSQIKRKTLSCLRTLKLALE